MLNLLTYDHWADNRKLQQTINEYNKPWQLSNNKIKWKDNRWVGERPPEFAVNITLAKNARLD
jgi:hypothetical protein